MGFHSYTGGGLPTTYCHFANGKLVVSSKTERDGFTPRVNKKGTTVYELFHDAFTGRLESVAVETNDYGTQVKFTCTGDGPTDRYVISCGIRSRYSQCLAGAFMTLLNERAYLTKPLTFKPYEFPDKQDPERIVSGVTLMHGGQKVPTAFASHRTPDADLSGRTKLPPPVEVVDGKGRPVMQNGKPLLNWQDQEDLFAATYSAVQAALSGPVAATPANDNDDPNSLPF